MIRTLLVVLLTFISWSAAGQSAYPTRPIHLIVPYPAGGGADVEVRAIAAKMDEHLSQPIVVENRAGASGNIGADVAAKSPADGYTVLLASATGAINAAAAANGSLKLDYDLLKDFTPVVMLVRNQLVLVANPSVPASNVRDLISLARTKPGALNYGSYGTGSVSHVAGELLKQIAGVNMTHIPYKGAAPLVTDLLGGQVDVGFVDVAVALPHIRSGKLKALAVAGTQRFAGLRDVPTMEESGVPGYEASSWLGLVVPTGTPTEVISRLRDAAVQALAAPDLREHLASMGVTPATDTSFGSFMQGEVSKWAKVLRAGGINLGS